MAVNSVVFVPFPKSLDHSAPRFRSLRASVPASVVTMNYGPWTWVLNPKAEADA